MSEIINVGGAEVESVLLGLSNVTDVTVYGEQNAITGHLVAARFSLREPEDKRALRKRMRQYCGPRLEAFKIPLKIEIVADPQPGERVKKSRHQPR